MKTRALLCLLVAGCSGSRQSTPVPVDRPAAVVPDHPEVRAFPGAEGFGAMAIGGRGGRVIKVKTLEATGPGSLQAALSTKGPRIVVFDVSGVITGDITIDHGDVTIAGQTAPGAGITIRGRLTAAYDTGVRNIVIRHVRVRPVFDGNGGQRFDAVQISRNRLVILDHVSMAFGVDETLDLYEAQDVTVQYCTIADSATSGHPEGEHNYGMINGPDGARISVHHNLFAHHKNRNPAIANGPADVRNNVVYNVKHAFVHHNPASGPFNITGNIYRRGPSGALIPFFFDDESPGDGSPPSYWLAGNEIDDPSSTCNGIVSNPWRQCDYDLSLPETHLATSEHDFSGHDGYRSIDTHATIKAYGLVLLHAGAFPRDIVTRRVINEVKSRSGRWGTPLPADLMAGLTPAAPPADADGDGMPDAWESEAGLDPADPSDVHQIMPSGYPAIEDYINERAAAFAP